MSSPRPAQDPTGPLHGVLEPIVTAAGLELVELEVRAVGRRHTVRLVVDGDAGVGLDDIAGISREAAAELDRNEHLIAGSYTLEVTSPGAERTLTQPRHWRRAQLRQVTVRLREGTVLTGRIGNVRDEEVTLLVDGSLRDLPYADIAHAAVQVEFRTPPEADIRKLGGSEQLTSRPTTEQEDPS